MPRSFISIRKRRCLICIFIVITIFYVLHLFSNAVLIGLANRKKISLREIACVINARRFAHNLNTVNGWNTNNYLNSLGHGTYSIKQYWNEDERFRKFNFTEVKICSIIYCGAQKDGTDGLRFAREYPSCYIWFLEPVLSFYEQFVHSSGWKFLMTSNASGLYNAYSYGLSNRSTFIDVAEKSSSEGQALSSIREQKVINPYQRHKLIIRDVSEILFELKILRQLHTNFNTVDGELTLMHMNCDGCEYEVLERLIDTNLIKHIRYLQFETYRPIPIQSTIAERYCSVQEKLSNTHLMEYGIPWAWERWILK